MYSSTQSFGVHVPKKSTRMPRTLKAANHASGIMDVARLDHVTHFNASAEGPLLYSFRLNGPFAKDDAGSDPDTGLFS